MKLANAPADTGYHIAISNGMISAAVFGPFYFREVSRGHGLRSQTRSQTSAQTTGLGAVK